MNVPPRSYIILARDKPLAVIISRGPSDWYHIIKWDTLKDKFEHGAWFKGRIYEEKCDLSPDGELFLYFALKGNWQSSYEGSWTAVSRPPWLSALTLWPEGGTWGGGGCFQGNKQISLNGAAVTHPDHPLGNLQVVEGICKKMEKKPDIPDAEWCGYDQRNREIYTKEGKVFRRMSGKDKELANFNNLVPDPKEAPNWAQKPVK